MKKEITNRQPSFNQGQLLGRQNRVHSIKNRQTGFSFVEVVVAALILSVSILGIASLQITSMKGTQQSAMKGQAMGVIQNLTERMRSNYQGVIDGDYVINNSDLDIDCTKPAPLCSTGSCASNLIAELDKYNLVCGYGNSPRTAGIKRISAGDIGMFVNGKLKVTCAAGDCTTGEVTIKVDWVEGAFGEETVGAPDSLTLNTKITAP